MRFLPLTVMVAVAALALGCNANSSRPASEPSAYARLQSIPAADPAKFGSVRDFKSWRNPYLIVHKDGVGLLDLANNEQHLLKLEELTDGLARLSLSAWPYGRVVAVAEDHGSTPEDEALMRKNRGIVAGTLENLHILINWVPSS